MNKRVIMAYVVTSRGSFFGEENVRARTNPVGGNLDANGVTDEYLGKYEKKERR